MGGNAFPTPAHRLTSPQITALFAYAKSHLLAHLFPGDIEILKYTEEKVSHEDIDVLVPCEWAVGMKGQETGLVEYNADTLLIEASPSEVKKQAEAVKKDGFQETKEDLSHEAKKDGSGEVKTDGVDEATGFTAFCMSVATALKGL